MTQLWLKVHERTDWPSVSAYTLWHRDVALEHAPDPGDTIMLLASDEEPEGAVLIDVCRRYWSINGTLNLKLREIVHLPNEEMDERIAQGVARHDDHLTYIERIPMPWRATDDEHGTLDDRLEDCGWRRYAPAEA